MSGLKKILFLTASYPDSRRSATILCTHRVLECVAASGRYEVHVLAMRYNGEQAMELLNGIRVHRFKPSFWKRLRNAFENSHRCMDRIMEVTQKTLTIPGFPQKEPFTELFFSLAAKHLHELEHFDLIVTEHHGLETLLAGCRMKRRYPEVKHLALLWDPVKGQIATVYLPKSYTDSRINKVEEYVARYTDLQISTISMREYHSNHGDIAADHRKYLDIPSILLPDAEVPTEYLNLLRKGCINIVFSGLLTVAQRDPRPFIKLLNRCRDAEKINLLFFSMGGDAMLEDASKSFHGSLVIHNYIPINELHTLYAHADYLLNVSHINANMVPSKIFEYMSYGRPVISTFETEGDAAARYVGRYPEGLCIDLKKPESDNVNALDAFFAQNHSPVPFDEVQKLFANNTPETYLAQIDEFLKS